MQGKRAMSTIFLMVEIALIISALVFAGLLISKTTSFTGMVTKEVGGDGVTSSAGTVDVNYVIGKDASDGSIDTLVMRIETASEGINLEDSLVIINVGNVSAKLKYRNGTLVEDVDNGYYTR
jgi:archaellin